MKNNGVKVVAEVGSVHDGSFGNALKLIEVAAGCGADAVKFQTHIAEAETLRDAPMPPFFKGEPRFEYFDRTGFNLEQWQSLKAKCDDMKIEFMSAPFSIEAVELLEDVGMKRYKIPSGEITNIPYLEVIAETRKPVILSSGMSSWQELDDAVNVVQKVHNDITVLQCTTEYPCPHEETGLNVILEMRDRYALPVGLSDHTLTPYASLAAVTLGASVIEKHLTFSRLMYGSDAAHSQEPDDFQNLVDGIRAIEIMMSNRVDKDAMVDRKQDVKIIFQKSIVSIVNIPKGTIITRDMIGFKKPGTGIPANKINDVVTKTTKKDIHKDTIIREEDIL